MRQEQPPTKIRDLDRIRVVPRALATAIEQGGLAPDEDPEALTFELHGLILAANTSFVLRQDEAALTMARHVLRRRLGNALAPSTEAPASSPSTPDGTRVK